MYLCKAFPDSELFLCCFPHNPRRGQWSSDVHVSGSVSTCHRTLVIEPRGPNS
ncbi:hypothetical protein DPMN_143910 [Dreissena polymorpha]|uniref:Uncharacterized protein n=1 Tax=Dreissena polymorpha TaxID=45954 RepID=A0A9D4JNP2_DREPO|nr:hypothetical protein DPMN_143910 [Dreissena polymorpha]